jgi:hypothetical protein
MHRKPGRPSSNELSTPRIVAINASAKRAEAPKGLTCSQARRWKAIVDAMPGGWLGAEAHDALAQYCRHITTVETLAERISDIEEGEGGAGFAEYDALLRVREREGRAALAIARALRMTPQARQQPKTAGRAYDNNDTGARPWEF